MSCSCRVRLLKSLATVDSNSTVVVYNSRKITMNHGSDGSGDPPLHEHGMLHVSCPFPLYPIFPLLDLVLLSSLEFDRLGKSLENVLFYSGEQFSSHDFLLMSSFAGVYGSSGEGKRMDVTTVLTQAGILSPHASDSSVKRKRSKAKTQSQTSSSSSLSFTLLPSFSSSESQAQAASDISLVFVLDPLTVAGQRAAAIMKLIQEHLHLTQTVVLCPKPELSEFPLQNFYRYVLAPHHQSSIASASEDSKKGMNNLAGAAVFKSLPRQHTLTVRIDGPEPWNIQATSASQVCLNQSE